MLSGVLATTAATFLQVRLHGGFMPCPCSMHVKLWQAWCSGHRAFLGLHA